MIAEQIPNNWQPPAELGYSSLRPVRLAAGGYVLAVTMVLMVAGGLIGAVLIARQSQRQTAERSMLRAQGVNTEGTVVDVWRASNKERERRIRYRFTVGERIFTETTKVPRTIWDGLKAGQPLAVRYVPADPAISHPVEWERGAIPEWVAFLLGPSFAALGIFLAWAIRRQWRLLGEGRPAPGIVTGVKRSDKAIQVKYEFRLMSGAMQKGRGGVTSRKNIPAVGSVVCVLYDPDNPRRNALYPLQLVKLDKTR